MTSVKVPKPEEEGELMVFTADGKGGVMRPGELAEDAITAAHQQLHQLLNNYMLKPDSH